MICDRCLAHTRVFGVCVRCLPKPGAAVTSPVLRWFLDTLAERPEWTLTDAECGLIQEAAKGYERAEHHARYSADRPPRTETGEYEGVVGDRWTWEGLKCERVQFIGTGEWGDRYLVTFRSRGGNQVVWFTGEGGTFDPTPGEAYRVTASVKSHQVFGGTRQTVIQRPKHDPPADGQPERAPVNVRNARQSDTRE